MDGEQVVFHFCLLWFGVKPALHPPNRAYIHSVDFPPHSSRVFCTSFSIVYFFFHPQCVDKCLPLLSLGRIKQSAHNYRYTGRQHWRVCFQLSIQIKTFQKSHKIIMQSSKYSRGFNLEPSITVVRHSVAHQLACFTINQTHHW